MLILRGRGGPHSFSVMEVCVVTTIRCRKL